MPVVAEFVLGFCLLLIAVLIEAKLAGGKRKIAFHGHASCGEAHCRTCLKLSKLWFTRYPC